MFVKTSKFFFFHLFLLLGVTLPGIKHGHSALYQFRIPDKTVSVDRSFIPLDQDSATDLVKTPRVLIRPCIYAEDMGFIEKYFDEDPEIAKGLDLSEPIRPWLSASLANPKDEAVFSVLDRRGDGKEVIGFILYTSLRDSLPLLTYSLNSKFKGQGLMTEAVVASVLAILDHYPKINSIFASILPDNKDSARVLVKSGFREVEVDDASVSFELKRKRFFKNLEEVE